MRNLILNADDFGLTDGISRGIRKLLDAGAVTDTTVMLAVEGAAERAVAHGGKELQGRLGLHLQLTSGRPVLPYEQVPSLVDAQGYFRKRNEQVAPDVDDVVREWDAQVALFCETFGFVPNHLDSHHSVHDIDRVGDVYLALAARLNVPVRRGRIYADAAHRVQFGVKGPEGVVSGWTGQGLGVEGLKREILAGFAQGVGTLEVVCHPGYSDEGLRAMSSLHDQREDDLRALKELVLSGWYEAENIRLSGYRHLFV